jgi:hypothetical protein
MSITIDGVLKHGIGYDLVVVEERSRLVLAIRCHTCKRLSFHPTDVSERYCGACHVFHEATLGSQQA